MTSVPKTPWAAPLAALHRMNEALAQAVTTAEVVQGSFAGVLSELGAGSVAVWLVNDEQTALEFVRAVGSIEETVSRFAQLPMDASLPGPRVVVTRRPVTYSSTKQRDADWPQLTGIPTATEAVAILPLVARQACLGCLSIGFVEQREFTDEDLSFMAAVADQCALAFDRARLFDAEHAARATLEFLAEATRLMVSSLDPDEVLRRLVELAVPRLGDWCAVMVEEDGMLRLAALRVAGLPHVTERAFPDDPIAVDADSPTARAFRTGEVQEVPEIPEAAQSLLTGGPAAEAVRAVPIRSGVVVPIVARGEPIGTLGLMSSAAGRRYDSQLRYAAEGFAARAGIALDNARRFDEERRTARTLTEALLPGRLPDLPGYRCATRYLPAAGNVCGDWFDMLRTPTGKVMFGVGDAAGHGIPAASLMAKLRNAARGLALAGHRPGQPPPPGRDRADGQGDRGRRPDPPGT